MKKGIAIFCILFLWGSVCLAQEVFIPGTEDVPLADGLVIVSGEEDVSFDTPAGQILIVEAASDTLSAEDVLSFYRRTLPALGWQQEGMCRFERESESLTISVQKQHPVSVRFELSPCDF